MVNNKLYQAIIKSVVGRSSVYIIQFLSLAIYARLFTPQEFGIIASIQVFVIFFQMLANIGIGPAIINENSFAGNKRNGIFTVTAILGCSLAIIFYFFSFALNKFYGGFEYQDIAVLVCIAIMFNALLIIPVTALTKDTKFIHIAKAEVIVELMVLCIIYQLYLLGYGVIALASKPLFQSVFKFFFLWLLSANTEIGRPYFGKELFHIKSILKFSSYQFGFNFINYFSRNLDNILIAKYFGMSSVGIYEKSYQLMRYPLMVTTFAMNPAIQPVLTKMRDDVSLIVDEHNRLTGRLFAISLIISTFLYVNSHSIILLLFGDAWLSVEPLIKIFSFMIPIQAVLSTSGAFYQVMNKPKLLFVSGLLSAFFNIVATITGIYIGKMEYVAYALVISFSINFFQCYYIMFKYCFKHSVSILYKKLFKIFIIVLMPVIIYVIIETIISQYIMANVAVDLMVNIGLSLLCLLMFHAPLKRVFMK